MKKIILFVAVVSLSLTAHPPLAAQDGDRVIPPDLLPITVNNIDQLTPLTTFGFGVMRGLNWSPDGRTLMINASTGVWRYVVGESEYPRLLDEDAVEPWMQAEYPDLQPDDLTPYMDFLTPYMDFPGEKPSHAVLSADGTRLATADEQIRVWDTQRGTLLASMEPGGSYFYSMSFSADGERLAAAIETDVDTMVKVWDVRFGQEIAVFRGYMAWVGLALNADGSMLALTDIHGLLRIQDVDSGSQIAEFYYPQYPLTDVAFHPDGETVASAMWIGGILLWDVATGRQIEKLSENSTVDIAFAPDGTLLGNTEGGTPLRWDLSTGELLEDLGSKGTHHADSAFSPDGNLFAVLHEYHDKIHVWDVNTDAEVAVLAGHEGQVCTVAFSPDGELLLSGGCDGTIRLWDTATWQEQAVIDAHEGGVWSLTFSPDGRLLVSSGGDGAARLWYVGDRYWDTCQGTLLAVLFTNRQQEHQFAFSPDGRILVSSACQSLITDRDRQCSLVFWDVVSAQAVRVIQVDYAISSYTFNPAGTLLAVGSTGGGVRLWGVPVP